MIGEDDHRLHPERPCRHHLAERGAQVDDVLRVGETGDAVVGDDGEETGAAVAGGVVP